MEKISLRTADSRSLQRSVKRLASIASAIVEDSVTNTSGLVRNLGSMMDAVRAGAAPAATAGKTISVPCCPPDEECPPACILTITRTAHPDEVIMVPFKIHNASAVEKSYKVGIRPMVDQHQNPAPSQPSLNKTHVTIPPLQSALFEMRIDLRPAGYDPGDEFQATIVVREKECNQNICFELTLVPYSNVPEATPWDEAELKTHFLGWQYHFYCDDPRKKPTRIQKPKGKSKQG